MKILLAPDKFKGSISAFEFCKILRNELSAKYPNAEIIEFPMADGGDGSIEIIARHINLTSQSCETKDPLGRRLKGHYYRKGKIAFIELATASGIVLLSELEKNPLQTSTFGTGLMMRDAIEKGCTEIFLFLGGSATNDGGIGIAQALGITFFDTYQKPLNPIGENLIDISSIAESTFLKNREIDITLLCDVTNPLHGLNGAAHVFGKQKGASERAILQLDKGLKNFADVLFKESSIDVHSIPGMGAAGGVGASLVALLGAKIKNGFEAMVEITGFQNELEKADIVISGEGKLDAQSLDGKVISGVAKLCRQYHKPLYLIVGKNELSADQLRELAATETHAIFEFAKGETDAIENAEKYLKLVGSALDF